MDPEQIIDSLVGWEPKIEFLAEMIRAMTGEHLAGFADWVDASTFNPELPLERPTFAYALLVAIDRWQVADLDPAMTLHTIQAAVAQRVTDPGAEIDLPQRLADLAPEGDE